MNQSDFRSYQQAMMTFVDSAPAPCDGKACGVGMFADMGAGKTVVGATWLAHLLASATIRRGLVVTTNINVTSTWPREFAKWDHLKWVPLVCISGPIENRAEALKQVKSKALVAVVSYEAFVWMMTQYLAAKKPWPFQAVVFDESTAMKDMNTLRARVYTQKFERYVGHTMIMTGTAAPQGYKDLYGQLALLDRGYRLGRTQAEFATRYGEPAGYMGKDFVIRDDAKPLIREAISDICTWVDPSIYLPVHKQMSNFIQVPLSKANRTLYRTLEREFIANIQGTDVTVANAAVLSNKLRQMCNGFIYDESKTALRVHDDKLEALQELAESSSQPLLIAVDFTEDAKAILKRFPKFKFLKAGDTTLQDAFNAGLVPGILGNVKSISRGIDLQHGTNVVAWYGMVWSGELYVQLNARCGPVRQAQSGLNRGSIVHHIVAEDTIEDRVMARLAANIADQEVLHEYLAIAL